MIVAQNCKYLLILLNCKPKSLKGSFYVICTLSPKPFCFWKKRKQGKVITFSYKTQHQCDLPISRSVVCVRASVPELSRRSRLLAPCCKVSMLSITRRKRACGIVPRLGPDEFSLVIVCRGTGWIPSKHWHSLKFYISCSWTQEYTRYRRHWSLGFCSCLLSF